MECSIPLLTQIPSWSASQWADTRKYTNQILQTAPSRVNAQPVTPTAPRVIPAKAGIQKASNETTLRVG